jgi:hypothetical protein
VKRFLLLFGLLLLVLVCADAWTANAGGTFSVDADLHDDLGEGGGRTARHSFFDHEFVPRPEREVRGWRGDQGPGVEAMGAGTIRFRYRDRDYGRVWILVDRDEWEPRRMELDRRGQTWIVEVELGPGPLAYQFRVEREDGSVRDRTDPTNPDRRREPERGWVSTVEIGQSGEIELRERRSRREEPLSSYDLHLFSGIGAAYQRVDGFVLEARPSFESRDPWAPVIDTHVAYGFSSEKGMGQVHFLQPLVPGGRVRAVLTGYDMTDYTDRTAVGDTENSLATLAFREDSRDWYRRQGLAFGVELEQIERLLLRAEFRSDEYGSLPRRVFAGWGGRDDFRPNPEIDEGIMRSILLRARWGSDLTHLWLQYENGRSDWFSSDFDFEQLIVQGRLRWRIGWAQTLHLRARWGTRLSGRLPVQKQFVAGGLGTVRGYVYQSLYEPVEDGAPVPYGGDQLGLFNAEYVLGLHDEVAVGLFFDSGMVHARTGALRLDDFRSTIGLGLLLAGSDEGSLRLDFARPLGPGASLLVQGRLTRPF